MNVLKIALLGTAALAAVSVSARADDLADLKAQIEALNGRISQLESTPSIPAGYQLLSVSEADAIIIPGVEFDKAFGTKATNIGIMPTADVPASANIQWSGYVKAAVVYDTTDFDSSTSTDTDAIDVMSKVGLKVAATTETAVGEVGVTIALYGERSTVAAYNAGNPTVATDGYWGYWKMTPELTLGGGLTGSLSGNGQGFDANEQGAFTGDGAGGFSSHPDDPSQIRLSYASGPLSFAIALEDGPNTATKSGLGVAGELKYSGDSIGFELNAGVLNSVAANSDDRWTINAGANMGLGDIATLSLAAGIGDDDFVQSSGNYKMVSAFAKFTLSDAVDAEIGATYKARKGPGDILAVGGGIYYTPVDQLTLGLEADYTDTKGVKENMGLALAATYRF